MIREEVLAFKNWSNFPEPIHRSLTLRSLESFPTIKTEEYEGERMHFTFLLSIGPDCIVPKVTESS
jgi:hypothetical protein